MAKVDKNVRRRKTPKKAQYKLYIKSLDISIMSEAAVTRHMEGKKRRDHHQHLVSNHFFAHPPNGRPTTDESGSTCNSWNICMRDKLVAISRLRC